MITIWTKRSRIYVSYRYSNTFFGKKNTPKHDDNDDDDDDDDDDDESSAIKKNIF